jgi:hypothetical protein
MSLNITNTETPPDTWSQTQQLILLAFHDDNDIAYLAGQELLARLDMPAIPLAHDDGRRKVIRREIVHRRAILTPIRG